MICDRDLRKSYPNVNKFEDKMRSLLWSAIDMKGTSIVVYQAIDRKDGKVYEITVKKQDKIING
jgi:hypothetical protein